MSRRHRVFVSYHHANDESYRKIFELRFGNSFGLIIPGSVRVGDIRSGLKADTIRRIIRDEYLRDTSVTVVLIGTQTWQRKHVDWEISSSLRRTDLNPRSGLLGLFLRSHPDFGSEKYHRGIIPPRLYDNAECGYAVLADWSEDPEHMQSLVQRAYLNKSRVRPDNHRPLFQKNRWGSQWT